MKKTRNSFGFSEWSGSLGDLGILLPLVFMLSVCNGFPVERLFLLWGVVYILTGFFYKIPISVQPLKAMAVISITMGFSAHFIASTAVFYGLLLLVLSLTGGIRLLQKYFSKALIRGIQLGVGIILLSKVLSFLVDKGLFLQWSNSTPIINFAIFIPIVLIIIFVQFHKRFPITIFIVLFGIAIPLLAGIEFKEHYSQNHIGLAFPDFALLLNGLIFLIIPQFPLTLGNAVISASDVCKSIWKDRAVKATPTNLASTIGVSNIFIGFLGGFPICHGASGMVAHRQFGGKTGGTTIILGSILILFSLVPLISTLPFLIPIPVLGALLFFPSLKLIMFIKDWDSKIELFISISVAIVAYFSKNLAIAMLCGFVIEKSYSMSSKIIMRSRTKAKTTSFVTRSISEQSDRKVS